MFIQAWIDWKGNVRRKLAHNKTEVHATGGGSFKQFILSRVDEEIAVLCGLYRAADGIENAKSFGVQDANKENERQSSPSLSSPALSPQLSSAKKRKQDTSLQRFMEKETQHLGAIRSELEKMCDNNKFEELSYKLDSIDGKLKKLIDIKKEQLDEIKKDRQERKRHNRAIENHNSLMLKNSLEKVKLNLQLQLEKMKFGAMT